MEPFSHPLTLLLSRIRHTKRLTSTYRAYARGSYWQLRLGRFHSVSVISSHLQRVGALKREDRIDEIVHLSLTSYSHPTAHLKHTDSHINWNLLHVLHYCSTCKTRISCLYFYRAFMISLFMSVANYQNLKSQILALTYDALSISSHSHFYSECVSLNYHRSLLEPWNRVSGHLNCSYVRTWDILFFYLLLQLTL